MARPEMINIGGMKFPNLAFGLMLSYLESTSPSWTNEKVCIPE